MAMKYISWKTYLREFAPILLGWSLSDFQKDAYRMGSVYIYIYKMVEDSNIIYMIEEYICGREIWNIIIWILWTYKLFLYRVLER